MRTLDCEGHPMGCKCADCKEADRRMRRARSGRSTSRGAGPIARGIATAGIVGAVYGTGTTVPMSGETPLRDEGTRQAQGERGRRGRETQGGTRDQGGRNRGSGKS